MSLNNVYIDYVDIEGRINPIGIDHLKPMFHYTTASQFKGKSILYHQLRLMKGNVIYWDTGKVVFGSYPYIYYDGPNLEAKTRYDVHIRVWDEQDIESSWHDTSYFETGMLNEVFIGDWIEPIQNETIEEEDIPAYRVFQHDISHYGGHKRLRCAQNLRRSFNINCNPVKGRIYASAHGIYELYLNGKKVGNSYLNPGISSYNEYLYYQTYDISELLKMGDNCLAVTLADGWWCGRIGLIGSSCQYGNKLGFICQIEIEDERGESIIIGSDSTFKCHDSEIEYADLYIGEKKDFRKELINWKNFDFEDSSWSTCTLLQISKNNLIGQPIEGTIEYQHLLPECWITTPKNEMVVDFGQVIAGTMEITVDAFDGQELIFEYSEVLDKKGNYIRNIMGRNKDQTDSMICKAGIQTWRPLFTYHGFRFMKITGIDRENIKQVKAIVLTTDMNKMGEFNCSDERINQLQRNIVWSQRGNMIYIPTDCPQREKMGWTGDIQMFCKTGVYNSDLRAFLKTWLMNLRSEQLEDGAVPVIIPNFPKQEKMQRQIGYGEITSSGWSDACILLPWYLYQLYGDISLLEENFTCMNRYLDFVKKQASQLPISTSELSIEEKARNPYLWNKGYHYGDWLIPSMMTTPDGISKGREVTREIVGSCWYAITIEAYIYICKQLECELDWNLKKHIQENEDLLKKIRSAIEAEYVEEDGKIKGIQLQGLYIMVLKAKVVSDTKKNNMFNYFVDLINKNNHCLDAGFSSISFLLDILSENNRIDLAYQLLFQEKSPSWLFMVNHGATTIWEHWEAITPDSEVTRSSYNHYMYGCIGDWMYRRIGGIQNDGPGYREIIFEPGIDSGLTSSFSKHITPFGKTTCEWQKTDDEVIISIVVPVGAFGKLKIRDICIKLESGSYLFNIELK